ncbi:MAG TPA: DAK2 domain-containing protein, partial [Acidimicrobiales bacterium]|nr:DAK2 domain-containing protein [Acidimicrobiales bacterium]
MQLDAGQVRALVCCYRDALRTHAEALDRLNVFPVPDSDTGTNLLRTMDAVVRALPPAGADLPAVCGAVTDGALMGARGNSGVILSQVLRGLTGALAAGEDLGAGLAAAAAAARTAVLEPVEGTVLTVADAAAGAGARAGGSALVEVLEAARVAAADALARTPEQLPVLAEAGVVDDRPVPPPPVGTPSPSLRHTGPRYEVTYLIEAPAVRVDDLRHRLGDLGDSVAVSGGEGRWSCHV